MKVYKAVVHPHLLLVVKDPVCFFVHVTFDRPVNVFFVRKTLRNGLLRHLDIAPVYDYLQTSYSLEPFFEASRHFTVETKAFCEESESLLKSHWEEPL